MSATDVRILEETELDRVERWRAEELERAGYERLTAVELAASPEVDLHRAIELLQHGCPSELAAQILL